MKNNILLPLIFFSVYCNCLAINLNNFLITANGYYAHSFTCVGTTTFQIDKMTSSNGNVDIEIRPKECCSGECTNYYPTLSNKNVQSILNYKASENTADADLCLFISSDNLLQDIYMTMDAEITCFTPSSTSTTIAAWLILIYILSPIIVLGLCIWCIVRACCKRQPRGYIIQSGIITESSVPLQTVV